MSHHIDAILNTGGPPAVVGCIAVSAHFCAYLLQKQHFIQTAADLVSITSGTMAIFWGLLRYIDERRKKRGRRRHHN